MISVPMFELAKVTDEEGLTKIASQVISSHQHILGKNVVDFENKIIKHQNEVRNLNENFENENRKNKEKI